MIDRFARWFSKRKINLKRYLFSPFFLAILPTIVILMVLPEIFRDYKITEVAKEYYSDHELHEYHYDLDGDGSIERIVSYYADGKSSLSFLVYQGYEGFYKQFNFSKVFHPDQDNLYFHDIEGDGLVEVIGFTKNKDSVFLNWITPFSDNDSIADPFFVCTIDKQPGQDYDWRCENFYFMDLTGDGVEELVFIINAGFSLQPRAIYAYNPVNQKIFSSESVGSPCTYLDFQDINGDDRPECIASTAAPSNIDSLQDPIDDHHLWIKVYNPDLSWFMDPIQLPPGEGNRLLCKFGKYKGQNALIFVYGNRHKGEPSFVQIRDADGNLLKMMSLPVSGQALQSFEKLDTTYLLQFGYNNLILLSEDMELIDRIELPVEGIPINNIDIDEDGQNEYFLRRPDRLGIVLFTNRFTDFYKFNQGEQVRNASKVDKNLFSVQTTRKTTLYSFKKNMVTLWRIPIYLAIYLFVVLIIWGIKRIQEIQTNERLQLESEVRKLQLTSIKNQMDPHFTFNSLNVVSELSLEGRNDKVETFVRKFSTLLRKQLESSDLIRVTLQDELEFVDNYMDIQGIRHEKDISLIKHIDPDLLEFLVPKMLVHTHVENAIKHGLLPKGGGVINIKVYSDQTKVLIAIQDNGIGREAAQQQSTLGSGSGLKVLEQVFRLYNQLYKVSILQEIVDLFDEAGKPAGTVVNIVIPKSIR